MKRVLVQHLVQVGISQRQACAAVRLPRSTAQYQPVLRDDTPVIEALQALLEKHPAIGFWMCYYRLRKAGHRWNHKRLYRVYTALKLNLRRRARKRLPARRKAELFQPSTPNTVWSLDFMHDGLWDGRTFRMLNILDDFNRELLAIEIDTSLPAQRVIRVLEQLQEARGLPSMLRIDNGPEFISHRLADWCAQRHIQLAFIQPGKPTQNAYVERCNRSIREELLNAWVFRSLREVREKAEAYLIDYNSHRPHSALNYRTPLEMLPP